MKREGAQHESKAPPPDVGIVPDIESKDSPRARPGIAQAGLGNTAAPDSNAKIQEEPPLDAKGTRKSEIEKLLKFAREAKPQILPSVEVMQLARSWERRYAGWDTEILEARYFDWKKQGCHHDKECLICVEACPDYRCSTCQRAYHKDCLRARFRQKEKDPQSTALGKSGAPSWYCPLCIKRTWNSIRPKDALTQKLMVEKDERGLTLQRRLKKDPKYAKMLTWSDNGTRECDFSLLFKLSAIDEQRLQTALQVDKDFVKLHEMGEVVVDPTADKEIAGLELKAKEMEQEIKVLRQIQRLDREREEVLSRQWKRKPISGRSYEGISDFEEDGDEYGFDYRDDRPDFMR